ncbi:hypothetical protein V2J09_003188 [Rumex salicifolius]
MASSEENPNKTLFDSPPSPTQPLLDQTTIISDQVSDPDHSQYLQISYNHGPRSFKDLPFLILFVVLVLATFGFGIFSIAHKNSNYSYVSSYYYDSSSSSCVLNSSIALHVVHAPRFSFFRSPFNYENGFLVSSDDDVLKGLIWTLVVTLILSLPIAWCVLLLLKHYTKQLVYVTLPFFVALPFGVNVYWFVACTVSSTCSDDYPLVYRILVLLFVFVVIGVLVWIFILNWHRIELTIQIIGVASDALSRNLGMFLVLPCLTLGLIVYYVPIVVFLVFSRFNGSVVASESSGDYSCVWKQDGWVPAYFALAIITMLWSATTMLEVQAYVISGTIAQWYFAKEGSTPRRKVRSSLRNAFGPSFGTVCFSGLIIGAVRIVRAIVDSASQEDIPGIVNLVLRCCVNIFLSAIDFLNKFTVNFAAITGEAYCSSARMTYELLRRNLLSAVFVETISTRLLAGIVLVISVLYGIIVCAIVNGVTSLGADSYLVAAMAWLLLLVILGFFTHVLDNVIDTVYICYAIDRDRGDVCKPDVHEVYVHLPISRSQRTPLISGAPANV